MNPMLDAIRQKRMGSKPEMEMEASREPSAAPMKDFMMQLSPEQKMQMLSLLMAETGSAPGSNIQQGEPSMEERAAIDSQMAMEPEDEGAAGADLDEEMLKQNPASGSGKGLGDKVRNLIMKRRGK